MTKSFHGDYDFESTTIHMKLKSRINPEINSSSMADIAFLLLIFFLVTTTIVNDKGIFLLLPPKINNPIIAPIHERNLYKININSIDQIMANNELRTDIREIRSEIKEFVLNRDVNPKLSESPIKAVVSIKSNRGTSYAKFIEVLNSVQGAYYDIYAERANLSNDAYRNLKYDVPEERNIMLKAKKGIPMNISIAEPTN